ncbi:hypothetical protein KDH_65830 [Dictyobacter sp. S3.2.2.5]|uniref:Polysaccharide biosynthesis protein C-terminal domain-containing protein n=1 Tax=Dictyobacter halimunensis TaxID=3026934 RepID=A0ABQ6FZR3_9CHLR|nr:hypothetical protein KDH_65830 [Dictyobacter sp. S3.2.2.5]
MIGFYITAISVVLIALTQGWVTALLALALVGALQLLEGEVLSPRIIGRAIGINPIIMIAALVAGNQLFGVIGALFAGSAAGFIQTILVAYWSYWKRHHDALSVQTEKEQDSSEQEKKTQENRPVAINSDGEP